MKAQLPVIRLQVDLEDNTDFKDVVEYFELFQSALRSVMGGDVAFRIAGLSKSSPMVLSVYPVREKTSRPLKGAADNFGKALGAVRRKRFNRNLSRDGVRKLSTLGRAFLTDQRQAKIFIGDEIVALDAMFVAAADELLGGYFEATGSVTGRLESLYVRGRRRTFRIYSEIPPYRVNCKFPDSMLPTVLGAILEHVEVTGVLKYRQYDPFPIEVRAERLSILPKIDSEEWLQLRGSVQPSEIATAEEVRVARDNWSW